MKFAHNCRRVDYDRIIEKRDSFSVPSLLGSVYQSQYREARTAAKKMLQDPFVGGVPDDKQEQLEMVVQDCASVFRTARLAGVLVKVSPLRVDLVSCAARLELDCAIMCKTNVNICQNPSKNRSNAALSVCWEVDVDFQTSKLNVVIH